ncbi:MAG: hypothetical protein ACOC3T_04945, partial [Bacteroidota bacterium]
DNFIRLNTLPINTMPIISKTETKKVKPYLIGRLRPVFISMISRTDIMPRTNKETAIMTQEA